MMMEAMSLERSLAEWPLDEGPTQQYALQLFWSADIERGRDLFRELADSGRVRKDPRPWPTRGGISASSPGGQATGSEAERYIADSLDVHLQFGTLVPPRTSFPAIIAAHRGHLDDARARARGPSPAPMR